MHPALLLTLQAKITDLIDANPDLADDDILRADMLEAETDLNDAVGSLIEANVRDKGLQKGLGLAIERMKAREARFNKAIDARRAIIETLMGAAELPKVKTYAGTASMSYRGPEPMKPDTVEGLPERFVRTKREIDMQAISAAFKAGEELPPQVHLTNGRAVLTIRS